MPEFPLIIFSVEMGADIDSTPAKDKKAIKDTQQFNALSSRAWRPHEIMGLLKGNGLSENYQLVEKTTHHFQLVGKQGEVVAELKGKTVRGYWPLQRHPNFQ